MKHALTFAILSAFGGTAYSIIERLGSQPVDTLVGYGFGAFSGIIVGMLLRSRPAHNLEDDLPPPPPPVVYIQPQQQYDQHINWK